MFHEIFKCFELLRTYILKLVFGLLTNFLYNRYSEKFCETRRTTPEAVRCQKVCTVFKFIIVLKLELEVISVSKFSSLTPLCLPLLVIVRRKTRENQILQDLIPLTPI